MLCLPRSRHAGRAAIGGLHPRPVLPTLREQPDTRGRMKRLAAALLVSLLCLAALGGCSTSCA
eukprot:4104-Eustigmatos_ZCMA.PRE.1